MPSAPGGQTQDDEVLLLRMANVLLRGRWLIAGTMLLVFAVTVVPPLVRGGRSYAAVTTFIPEAERQTANLSGLAAQFGLDIGGAVGGNSPQFYVDLLHSPHILRQVVDTRFAFDTDTGRVEGNLVELLNVQPAPPAVRRELAVRRLRDATNVNVMARTGVVELRVESDHAQLAGQIAARMLELLQAYNQQTRRTRASAERRFLAGRVAEVRAELMAAESALQQFLQRNRDYRASPELTFRFERLSRDAAFRQQLHATLTQRYEETRIEEVRDTPVLTVLDPPEAPVVPEPRGLIQKGIIAIVIGAVLGVLLAFLAAFVRGMRGRSGAEAREFSQLLDDSLADIRRPWRLLRRRPPAA